MTRHTLALYASDPVTYAGYSSAATRAGLDVLPLDDQPRSTLRAALQRPYFRAPGGLLAAAIAQGADIQLSGPSPAWFSRLGASVTGRDWKLETLKDLRRHVASGPVFAKLADAKIPGFPARRWHSAAQIDAARLAFGSDAVQLLITDKWLPIHSEYRVFTLERAALTCSPYLIEDEPYSRLLHTHRASFHDAALEHAQALLARLTDVPPAAALDIARLDSGTFILLEANQAWSAAPYGCDPTECLRAVIAANQSTPSRWRWTPDPALNAVLSTRPIGPA